MEGEGKKKTAENFFLDEARCQQMHRLKEEMNSLPEDVSRNISVHTLLLNH